MVISITSLGRSPLPHDVWMPNGNFIWESCQCGNVFRKLRCKFCLSLDVMFIKKSYWNHENSQDFVEEPQGLDSNIHIPLGFYWESQMIISHFVEQVTSDLLTCSVVFFRINLLLKALLIFKQYIDKLVSVIPRIIAENYQDPVGKSNELARRPQGLTWNPQI